jgi:hypothetical protein
MGIETPSSPVYCCSEAAQTSQRNSAWVVVAPSHVRATIDGTRTQEFVDEAA